MIDAFYSLIIRANVANCSLCKSSARLWTDTCSAKESGHFLSVKLAALALETKLVTVRHVVSIDNERDILHTVRKIQFMASAALGSGRIYHAELKRLLGISVPDI